MSETKHTPTPYHASRVCYETRWHVGVFPPPPYNSDVALALMEAPFMFSGGNVYGEDATKLKLANAEFIVRACNHHDELVAACDRAAFGMMNILNNLHGFGSFTPAQTMFKFKNTQEVLRGRIKAIYAVLAKIKAENS